MKIKFPKSVNIENLKFSKRKQVGLPNYIKWGSKFHNTPTTYKGRTYHSKKEAEYAMILDDMKNNSEIMDWKPQVTLKLDVNGKHICNYVADFYVLKAGVIKGEIHETKGYFTPIGKLKWRLAQALYGDKYKFVLIK